MENKKTVAIIGAGASGMMVALTIREKLQDDEVKIVLLDRLDRVGKKILSTGNGRCNFSNSNITLKNDLNNYYTNATFIEPIIKEFDACALSKWFEQKGLVIRNDSEGRMYPFTDTATSVLDILRISLKNTNVQIITNFDVKKINYNNKYIIQSTSNHLIEADYVVLSTGGKAAPVLGSNGSGYQLLKPWRVHITENYPGLVGLKVKSNSIKGLSGLRTKAQVKIYDKKQKVDVFEEIGEIQFKDDGVSGIVIMNASNKLLRMKTGTLLKLDFAYQYSEEELVKYLENKQVLYPKQEVNTILMGLCHSALANRIILESMVNLNSLISELSLKNLKQIAKILKNYVIEYSTPYDYDRAQITLGGIDLTEVDQNTLEIIKAPNLYACGEILDVDGVCGGYNLHFAFASGRYVGKALIKKITNE